MYQGEIEHPLSLIWLKTSKRYDFTPLATQSKRDFSHVSSNRNRGPNSVCSQVISHLHELTGASRCTSYLDWMEQSTSKCRGLGSSNRSTPLPVLKVA